MDFLTPVWNTIIYDPMLNSLLFLYSLVRNYGLAIILFTIIIGALTMPLRIKSQAAMKAQQAKTARVQPRLDELKKNYKTDPPALQQAQLKLYQEAGLVNPFNSGCLLTLLPFPIFIGLYGVITAVMGATPEQLLNLSQKIYPFFPQAANLIPVNPNFFGLNLAAVPSSAYGLLSPLTIIIVLLVVGSSWIQQKIMTPATASLDPQQAAMNNQMQLITPVIFGFFVVNAPVGLSVYWITFGLMTIIQQLITGGTASITNLIRPSAAPAKKAPPKRPKIKAEYTDGEDDETAEKPADKPVIKPVDKPADKPVGRRTVTPSGLHVEITDADEDEEAQDDDRAPDDSVIDQAPSVTKPEIVGPRRGKKKRGKKS